MSVAVCALMVFLLLPIDAAAQVGVPFFRNFMPDEYKAQKKNYDIVYDKRGYIFVANMEGLLCYDFEHWHTVYMPNYSRVTDVYIDSKERVWFGAYDEVGYVSPQPDGTLKPVFMRDTHNIGEVLGVYENPDGKIIVHNRNGAEYEVAGDRLKKRKELHLDDSERQRFAIKKLKLQGNDNVQGVMGEGIQYFDDSGKQLLSVSTNDGLCNNNINSLCIDSVANMWGATDNGIFAIKYPTPYARMGVYEGIHGEVKKIRRYKGLLYVGSDEGLYVVESNIRARHIEGVIGCHDMAVTPDNRLLIAAASGLHMFDGTSLRTLSPQFSLSVCPYNGMILYSQQDAVYMTDMRGNNSLFAAVPMVSQITLSNTGNLYFRNVYHQTKMLEKGSTRMTDVRSAPFSSEWETDDYGRNLRHVGGSDAENLHWLALFKDIRINEVFAEPDLLIVGYEKGISSFDRNYASYKGVMTKPIVQLREITYEADSTVNIWGGFPEYTNVEGEDVDLPSNTKHITFRYSSSRLGVLKLADYRYRIDNGEWSAWTTSAEYRHTVTGYGHHTFEVCTRNVYQNVSDPKMFSCYIRYPWYLKWYTVSLFILMLLMGMYFFAISYTRWRTGKLLKEQQMLEKKVDERTAELRRTQKELVNSEKMATVGKLTQGLIDRILNPMNYINNFSKMNIGLLKDLKQNVEDEREKFDEDVYDDCVDIFDMLGTNLEKIADHGLNTTRILKAMEGVLKAPKLNLKEHIINIELRQMVEVAKSTFKSEIEATNTTFTLSVPEASVKSVCDIQALSRVVLSIIQNSVYAIVKRFEKENPQYYKGGEISIVLNKVNQDSDESGCVIIVTDNGIGIEKTIIDKVFDPFFTTKTTAEAAGVGLYLCRSTINMMGGEIIIESEKYEYTKCTILLV
ncbi:MAG: HAMP domain-containing histidine kinase [Bacteroidaceae bacterium]|nr:HAMP domain-containing histidine kinase [Bacteroidaceae bacterium]